MRRKYQKIKMIKRIVKLTIREEEIPEFLALFESSKKQIRNFPGCQHLELWRSRQNPGIFFTYSIWSAEKDLELYRQSSLFREVWSKTKTFFADKPDAWSLEQI